MKLFAIGTKVKFLHTDDEGEVRSYLDEGMVSVYLPKYDMEIPTFPDDLMRMEEYLRHPVKAKVVEGKKEMMAPAPPPLNVETQFTILRSLGIQLAFDPVDNKQEVPEKYQMYLLNDTRYDTVAEIRLLLNSRSPRTWSLALKAVSHVLLGEFLYDDLNEAPEFEVKLQWVTTEGTSSPLHKSLKIKPKTFFGNLRTVPFLNKPVHWYKLFDKTDQTEEQSQKNEDLQSYTKRHAKPVAKSSHSHANYQRVPDTNELAAFLPEIDLHIEKLTDNWRKLGSGDILRVQLHHFDKFISDAYRLGVDRVFVIHGVGEGKLKDVIATRLMQNPDVQTFKNEYHHRYGWGATEVIF